MNARLRQTRSGASARWVLSYADLVTLLFALFAVLFASTMQKVHLLERQAGTNQKSLKSQPVEAGKVDLSKTSSVLNDIAIPYESLVPPDVVTPSTQRQALVDILKSALGVELAQGKVVITQTSDGLVISLREFGFFDSGQAKLLPGAGRTLQQIATVAKKEELAIRIEGHADDQPIRTRQFHSNWELSIARAGSVLQLLTERRAIDPSHLSIAGYGAYHPVSDNNSALGRRYNRRVDLVLIAPLARN